MSRAEKVLKLPEHEHLEDDIYAGCFNCGEQWPINFSAVEESSLPNARIQEILQADPAEHKVGFVRLSKFKCTCGGDLNIAVSATDGAASINPSQN